CDKAWVVHGAGGLDELSARGSEANTVAILDQGVVTRVTATMHADIDPDIRGGTASENADELRALLSGGGRKGHRDAVALTAAGALVVAGRAKDVPEGWPMALDSIASGAARAALQKLIDVSQGAA